MSRKPEYDSMELLDEIERVDAPPFLMTRIQQKIANVRTTQVSPAFAWSAGLATAVVLIFNIWVLATASTPAAPVHSGSSANMFFPKNALYE